KFLKLVTSLPKWHISLILWLQTTHVALNKHLHRLKKVTSPLCPYCDKVETVVHFLTTCPQYNREHHVLGMMLGRSAHSDTDLLTQPKAIAPLINYISSTGCLKDTFGNVSP
ncbi:hypothetical protein PAXRUDRAFT_54516, partial [Paxillus rubicundulus Ve08.2h10]